MSGYTIERVELTSSDESLLREVYAVNNLIEEETTGEGFPYEEWRAWLLKPSWIRWPAFVARGDGGEIAGVARIQFSDADNTQMGWGWLGVAEQHRRRGVGTALLRQLADEVAADGRSLLSLDLVKGHGGEELLRRYGLEERSIGYRNRTHVREIDADMLRAWVAQREERAGDYELRSWDGPAPDDIVERFAAARAIMNTAPLDDLEYEDEVMTPDMQRELDRLWQARGWEWTTMAAIAPGGLIAGYTQMFFSPWRPELAHQEDTGVHPDHRNRGIGRWLKAAMLLRVLDERPAVVKVDTGNAASNEPMLSINRALGFRPIITWGGWQGPVELVVKELEAKEAATARS